MRIRLACNAAVLLTLPLHGQQTANDAPAGASASANAQASAASQQTQQEIIQELNAMRKRIAQLEGGKGNVPEAMLPIMQANTLVPRLGQPEDIGPMAVYLASDSSSYVTGQTFVIDGGRIAH